MQIIIAGYFTVGDNRRITTELHTGLEFVKQLFLACTLVCLFGCDSAADIAKQALQEKQSRYDDIQYRDVQTFPGPAVCIKAEITDKWGESYRTKNSIYHAAAIHETASDDDWYIFCSNEPEKRLYEKFGISVVGSAGKALPAIEEDFVAIKTELKAQRNRIEKITVPNDPWGQPYIVVSPKLGGIAIRRTFLTYGADGVEGGQDENADIKDAYIKYIEHVKQMQ
jgi:hypothetical protein